ncbi:MAG: outer membrane beta-barrel domain-containing protein [Bradymonadia bacterium]
MNLRILRPVNALAGALAASAMLVITGLPLNEASAARKGALEKLEEGKAVRRRRLLRDGRFEATPIFGFSLSNPFKRNYYVGARLAYHMTDRWALGVTALSGFSGTTGLGDEITSQRQVEESAFADNTLLASFEAIYTPLYGKYAVAGRYVFDYDLHLIVGVSGASVSLEEASDVEGLKPGAVVGIGMRTFVDDWWSINVQFRDYIYSSAPNAVRRTNPDGSPTAAQAEEELSNNFTLTLGVGFYFPQVPDISD